MELDFFGLLFGNEKQTTETLPPLSAKDEPERETDEQRITVYRAYLENTKASSGLQTQILKGLKKGEDIYTLFLQAAEAISLITGNKCFYEQSEADIRAIYGRGINHAVPLHLELQSTQKRLQRLLQAEQEERDGNARERIRAAIKAHREDEKRLQTQIEKAEKESGGQ